MIQINTKSLTVHHTVKHETFHIRQIFIVRELAHFEYF